MGKRYGKSIKKQGENSKKQHNLPQITPEFTDKKLTNYGGLLVFAQFLNKLKFCKLVKNCIHVNRGSNSHYMTYDFVSMIVGGILCGAEHMNHVASICKDTVLQKIFDYFALFVIKVRLKNLKEILMRENIKWRKAMNSDIYETASFMYKCKDWSKARLFVAIRKVKDTNDDGFLFPIPEYEYFCYVTNLNYSPMAVHKRQLL